MSDIEPTHSQEALFPPYKRSLHKIEASFFIICWSPFYIRYMSGKLYHVYRYTNLVNGKMYDGCTCHPQYERAGKDGKGYKSCKYFWPAILEFGWPNFKYEVLEDDLTREQANERERYWIEHDNCVWPNGYNCTHGGQGGSYGVTDKRPPEWGEHISKSKKGKPGNVNRPDLSKRVQRFTTDGVFIAEYPSIREAFRQTGAKNIQKCLSGEIKTCGGSVWKYAPIIN